MKMFNYRLVARITGVLLLLMAVAMVLPLVASLHYRDGAQYGLLMGAVAIGAIGLLLRNIVGRHAEDSLQARESFWLTAAVWFVVPAAGALPYVFTGVLPNFTDAAFEAFSGFTTTGSSVVVDPTALPKGLLLWRALTQWFGGLGLILLVITLMKRFGASTTELYGAEFSGTQQRKLHPHMADNVRRLWYIYTLVTLILVALLLLCGNNVLESLCLAMSTVSTGGFMTSASGMAGYSSATLAVITVFMFASGVNLALIYNFFTFHWRRLRRNDEFVLYAVIFTLAVLVCTLSFVLDGASWLWSVHYSLFHIASTVSTCGFYIQEPVQWPFAAAMVTFLLIVSGAMAGSTGGGLKLRRIMTLGAYLRNYFTRMLHPEAVFVIKIDRQTVEPEYVNKIFGFIFLYILFIIGGAFVLTLTGSDIASAFCLAAANISNLGPSPIINNMGANLEYAILPDAAKWTLMVLMLAGRLEIFALLAVVSPSYWRRR